METSVNAVGPKKVRCPMKRRADESNYKMDRRVDINLADIGGENVEGKLVSAEQQMKQSKTRSDVKYANTNLLVGEHIRDDEDANKKIPERNASKDILLIERKMKDDNCEVNLLASEDLKNVESVVQRNKLVKKSARGKQVIEGSDEEDVMMKSNELVATEKRICKTKWKKKLATEENVYHLGEEMKEIISTRKRKRDKDVDKTPRKHDSISALKKTKTNLITLAKTNDVTSLLLKMEGNSEEKGSDFLDNGGSGIEDSSDLDWEEVRDDTNLSEFSDGHLRSLEIHLDAPELLKKGKKRPFDWTAYVKSKINVFTRDLRKSTHKVHLLCLLCHGMYINRLCCHPLLQAQGLSLLSKTLCDKITKKFSRKTLRNFLDWIFLQINFSKNSDNKFQEITVNSLQQGFEKATVLSVKEYIMMVVITLRALGLRVRIVLSLHPEPLREIAETRKVTKRQRNRSSTAVFSGSQSKNKKMKTLVNAREKSRFFLDLDEKESICELKKPASRQLRQKYQNSKEKKLACEENRSGGDFISYSEDQPRKRLKCSNFVHMKKHKEIENISHSESDFEEETRTFRESGLKSSKIKTIVTDNIEINTERMNQDINEWIEVYFEEEERWICINCIRLDIDKPYEIEKTVQHPLHYVLAYDGDGGVRDITARYASRWFCETRKLRVAELWWEETLLPYQSSSTEQNKAEDNEIKAMLLQKPMPTNILDYKNHPLYCLKRHLLKFQGIYPETAVPVGFVRSEPVYARECVHLLHSRVTWLKKARSIKLREEPYKIVRSRKKAKTNPELELFGYWQTEPYNPPAVVDGKVPRNEYGNVELFQPSMLPVGAVHLQEPGLNKVAKKLGIDIAAAMIGWDVHSGWIHPVFDGWVVCAEYKEILLAAYREQQEIDRKKEKKKLEQRVLKNWGTLVRGLLIREQLKNQYNLQEEDSSQVSQEEEVNDVELSWPRNRQKKSSKHGHYSIETM